MAKDVAHVTKSTPCATMHKTLLALPVHLLLIERSMPVSASVQPKKSGVFAAFPTFKTF